MSKVLKGTAKKPATKVKKADLSNIPPAAPPRPTKKTTKKRAPNKGKQCGAERRRGQGKCTLAAGFGTDHVGYGRCKYHLGNSPTHEIKAKHEMIQERMVKEARLYGEEIDIGPHEALLQEVRRSAGHVEWLREKIGRMEEGELTQYTGKDGNKESEWLTMYREERKLLVNVCKVAINAGIEERRVRLAEDQGKIVAMVLIKFVNDDTMAMTNVQRAAAPRVIRNLLMEMGTVSLVDTLSLASGTTVVVQRDNEALEVGVVER